VSPLLGVLGEMRCPNCTAENQPTAKFCVECGTAFQTLCVKCGFKNPPAAKFCQECGVSLKPEAAFQAQVPAPPIGLDMPTVDQRKSLEPHEIPEGERKTVTALFADIKGSMELMEDLDPEEARAIVDPALRLMMDAVHRYDGYIVQSTGDGIFALFGAPVAHEDHPQRALYAALRMQEDLRRYSDRLRAEGGLPIQARAGVNTGEVVVRSISTGEGHTEYTPIGHTANLASRMQTLAPVGSVAVTDATRKMCEGYFAFKSFGPTTVKGVSEPVNVAEVTGLGPLRTRLQAAAQRGFTKFVGREAELAQMRRALELAREGHGQAVAAMGDPGVGKSRLFFEFKAVSQAGCLVLEAYSVSHGKASAYLPVIDLLKTYFKIATEDDERARREKVNGKIITLDRSLEDTLPYLFGLLGIAESDDPLTPLDPQTRRRRTLEAIKRILVRESLSQPLIVEFEDLHWIDSETQALLNLLVEGIATARMVLLVNYRPEYHHQWGSKTYYSQLRLDPLGKESAQELLTALMGDDESTVPLKRLIIERTEGNPFFMEEMVQVLFEQGVLARNGAVKLVKPLDEIRVPPTVQAILASRIDRLPAAEKELLQTLAVLGREFPSGLIKRVTGKPDDELESMLSELQLAEFIYEQAAFPDIEYTFKHALTQEVAYNSVLAERRRLLHERAAQSIEMLFANRLEDHLTELAHHFDRSGNVPKAVEYLGRAAARAAQQVAHSEAIGYFTRALELLRRLPDGAARDRQELDLQMALSWSLFVAKGGQAPGHEHALVRAHELCERLGDNAKLMEALLALALLRIHRSDLELAQELAERVLAMAPQGGTPEMLPGAHFILGYVSFMKGQFLTGHEHVERAVELFGAGPARNYCAYFAQHAPNLRVRIQVVLGYPLRALRRAHELLATARRFPDPASIAFALISDGLHHVLLRDTRVVADRADEILQIAAERAMADHLVMATFFRGWAMAAAGRGDEGIAEMRRILSDPMFVESSHPTLMLVALAETCGKHGSAEEGLDLVVEGLATAEQTGQRVVEAELHRVNGELLMIKDPGNVAEAERCLRTAIDVARRQGARLFELRATVSFARLLKQQGKTDEARAMLADIYNWFTEGFDTADLKEAKSLLDELGA
jgi:class 3 adenylate cyclase/tetratricopeptide (TPR) repeat protein/ribosomal protein L40E